MDEGSLWGLGVGRGQLVNLLVIMFFVKNKYINNLKDFPLRNYSGIKKILNKHFVFLLFFYPHILIPAGN